MTRDDVLETAMELSDLIFCPPSICQDSFFGLIALRDHGSRYCPPRCIFRSSEKTPR